MNSTAPGGGRVSGAYPPQLANYPDEMWCSFCRKCEQQKDDDKKESDVPEKGKP